MTLIIVVIIVGAVIGLLASLSDGYPSVGFSFLMSLFGAAVGAFVGFLAMGIYGDVNSEPRTVTYTVDEWTLKGETINSTDVQIEQGDPGTVEVFENSYPGSFWGLEQSEILRVTYFVETP